MASFPNNAIHRNTGAGDTWQSSGQSKYSLPTQHQNGGMGEKISEMFGASKDSLPMYKDKPYSYGARRRIPWFRRKRSAGVGLAVLAVLSWWFGILSPLSWFAGSGGGGGSVPSRASKGTSWFGLSSSADWEARREKVKEAFRVSFGDYEKHGWGYDEYHPISKTGKHMTPKGMGWIIIDALDTMMIMNLTTELAHSREWLKKELTWDQDHDVNTFETTIRMLGGLLSAHYLSTTYPDWAPVKDGLSDDLYVEKAADLADRLLSAFETRSGVPLASVNLHQRRGIPSHADGGASSTAEATTVQLEFKYLAKLTGEDHYWDTVEKVMKVVDDNAVPDGLVPIFIYADQGAFRGNNIRLGSRGDSYYEYLIKQYLQTSNEEPIYQTMWNESMAGIKKHLLTYSHPSNFTVLAERQSGLEHELTPKMDHLVCFMPGTIALATTGGETVAKAKKSGKWGSKQDEDMRLAEELMKTCWGMYAVTATGLAPEIAYFHTEKHPPMYKDFTPATLPKGPSDADLSSTTKGDWTKDFNIQPADTHNLQRPETVESLLYMWRITGDVKYREWGWKMFESFMEHTSVDNGRAFSSVNNVQHVPPPQRDNMESFWLAETLKYFYLLFSPNDVLPLTDIVFNTEAHPFPRFQMGKLFKTGWERKSRDGSGGTPVVNAPTSVQTVLVTQTVTPPAAVVVNP